MANKATEDLLGELHLAVTKDLLAKVNSGEATAADLNAAIKLLKDNKIEANLELNVDAAELARHVLPTFEDELEDLDRSIAH